ncbi:MAG: hypothetical protein NC926_11375 [Candidatus Omnitrophica bacterium]|nr:hypothetical protein [Candidatus Omnitrophota bacterium]
MKNDNEKKLILILILIFLVLTLFISNSLKIKNKNLEQLKDIEEQEIINKKFEELINCESSNNELAINRKDSDGTASFGLLQWKPETFRRLAVKYGIIGEKADWNWIMTLIFDRRVNKKIFTEIMNDTAENPYNLWPICCKKIGCKFKN